MTEYGITSDGRFERKHVDTIIDELKEQAEQEIGDVDLNQSSPVKQFIDLIAIEVAEQWELSEQNYYVGFYEDASGEALDKLLALVGARRRERRSATGEVEFTVSDSLNQQLVIESGFEVTTQRTDDRPAIPFRTTEDVTVHPEDTTVMVPIRGVSPANTELDEEWLGEETNVSANTVTQMATPMAGIGSVTNPNPTGDETLGYVAGRDRETDAEFRYRYENTIAQSGDATLDAIRARVMNDVEEVIDVGIRENETMTDNTGSGGLPPKSFQITAIGGADQEIAQAIFESRPAGIQSYGDITETVTAEDGMEFQESFTRGETIEIEATCAVSTAETFPGDGLRQVEDQIVEYIGGTDNQGEEHLGTEIAEDVIYDQLFAAVMGVRGVVEIDLEVAIRGNNQGTDNIQIGENQTARTHLDYLTVGQV